jgi:hypothetical protein
MKSKGKLLYRLVPHNDGLVFATEERARYIARIHDAIAKAKTWADFRRAMPRSAYSAIVRGFDTQGEARPRASDEFSGEMLPGWSDGDYPAWLQQEMHHVIPKALLERYGRWESSVHNGNFWLIPPEAAETLCAALRGLGWEVEHAPTHCFH